MRPIYHHRCLNSLIKVTLDTHWPMVLPWQLLIEHINVDVFGRYLVGNNKVDFLVSDYLTLGYSQYVIDVCCSSAKLIFFNLSPHLSKISFHTVNSKDYLAPSRLFFPFLTNYRSHYKGSNSLHLCQDPGCWFGWTHNAKLQSSHCHRGEEIRAKI